MSEKNYELGEKIRPLLAWYFSISKENIHDGDKIMNKFYVESIELIDMCIILISKFDIKFGINNLATVDIIADIFQAVDRLLREKEDGERILQYIGREFLPSRLAAVKGIN